MNYLKLHQPIPIEKGDLLYRQLNRGIPRHFHGTVSSTIRKKNAFEYATYPGTTIPYEAINHSDRAVEFSISLARLFVRLTNQQQQQQHPSQTTRTHAYTKPDVYPTVNTFPVETGLAFEEIYIIPSASYWTGQTAMLATSTVPEQDSNTARLAIEATKTMQY